MPKFVRKNFVDSPSWEEIQCAFPSLGSVQRKVFPLNVKRVGKADLDKLMGLSFMDQGCKDFLIESLRILHDEDLYKEMTQGKKPEALQPPSLSRKELLDLEDYKFEKATTLPLWGTYAFKVSEPQKERCRCIFDCKINSIFLKTPKYTLKTKRQIREDFNSFKEDYIFIQFDFRSYYDQFPILVAIRKYFGFLGHDGGWYWLLLLPMGFRLAVAAAQATTWFLLNFPRSARVAVTTCIDNICFSGPREEVYKSIDIFLTRIFTCRFTLNGFEGVDYLGLSKEEKMKLFKSLEETSTDFLGESYDFINNQRKMTDKTVKKLEMVWGVLKEDLKKINKDTTNRQFFCLIGILVYATEILNVSTFKFFNLFKKIRGISSFLNKNDHMWDNKIFLDLSVLEYNYLEGWVETIIRNNPVHMICGKKGTPPFGLVSADKYIVLDASKEGWGAIMYNSEKEYEQFVNGSWNLGSDFSASVKAEPMGIEKAIRKWRDTIKGKRIAILTDHKNITYAAEALFVHSYFYNKCLAFLENIKRQDGTVVYMYFVPGVKNVADGISRGDKEVKDKRFPRVDGAGSSAALPVPWQT